MTIQPSDKVLSIRQTAAVMNLSVRTPQASLPERFRTTENPAFPRPCGLPRARCGCMDRWTACQPDALSTAFGRTAPAASNRPSTPAQ